MKGFIKKLKMVKTGKLKIKHALYISQSISLQLYYYVSLSK